MKVSVLNTMSNKNTQVEARIESNKCYIVSRDKASVGRINYKLEIPQDKYYDLILQDRLH